MNTLDKIQNINHGTPAGYTAGCRSRGACPNHHSRSLLTCVDAARARRRDFALSKLDPNEPITRKMTRVQTTSRGKAA
jgi:hypothetical protein